ncbi:MAG: YicC family protein [Deltaproteobacteria bacterium]|nr:YicC family protein [Candidatus Tharpella sp.]
MSDSLLSMTGYGEATQIVNDRELRCVVQSVNSRYLDCRFRLPHNFQSLEPRFKGLVKKIVERGKVDIVLSFEVVGVEWTDASSSSNYFNGPWIAGFCNSAEGLADTLGWPVTDHMRSVLMQSALSRREAFESPAENIEESADLFLGLLQKALLLHLDSRKIEGAHLAADFHLKISLLSDKMSEIELSAIGMPQIFKDRIGQRLASILEDGRVSLDESRLCQEVAYLVDKADISEEIVRFRAHISQFLDVLESETSSRKGKKLEFIVQEMLREINTVGSKANLLEITRNVVDIKNELEKIREQVQNVI